MSDVIEVILDSSQSEVIEVLIPGPPGPPGEKPRMPASTMLGNLESTPEFPQNLSAIQVRQWLDAPTNEDLTYYTLLSSFSSFVTWTEDELALKADQSDVEDALDLKADAANAVTPDELTQAITDATDVLVSDSDLSSALASYLTISTASTTYLALSGGTLTGNLAVPEYFVGGPSGPRLNTSGGTLRVRSNDNLSDGAFSSGAINCGSITTPNLILHDSSLNGQVTGVRVRNSNNGTSAQTRFELFNDASSGGNSGAAIFFCSSTFGGGFARVCGLWNFQAAGPVLIGAGNAERQRWHSGGNTSIGTATDNGVDRLQVSGSVSISTLLRLGAYTVATLPNAVTNDGAWARVTDSNSTTNGNIVAGSGSNKVPVFSNGTNWIIK